MPTRDLFFSAYVLNQFAEFTVPSSASISLTARQMGYQDVVDPVTGEVLYPAEAFFYGGKANVNLPVGSPDYLERSGQPRDSSRREHELLASRTASASSSARTGSRRSGPTAAGPR